MSLEIVRINRLIRKLNKLKRNLKKNNLEHLSKDETLDYLNDSLDLLANDCDSFCLKLKNQDNDLDNHLLRYQYSCNIAKYLLPFYTNFFLDSSIPKI